MSVMTELAPKRTGGPTTRIGVGIDTLAVWPLRRLPARRPPARRRRTVLRRIRQRLLPVPCASRRVGRPPPCRYRLLHHPPGCRRSLRRQSPALPAPPRRLLRAGQPPSPLAGRDITVSLRRPSLHATKTTAPPSSPPASPGSPSRHAPRPAFAISGNGPPAHLLLGVHAAASCARRPRACRPWSGQRTRLINQLHYLLVPAFPELALIVKDISLGWVLELLHRYTPPQLCWPRPTTPISPTSLTCPSSRASPSCWHRKRGRPSPHWGARPSPSWKARPQVRQLRDVNARQQRLEGDSGYGVSRLAHGEPSRQHQGHRRRHGGGADGGVHS